MSGKMQNPCMGGGVCVSLSPVEADSGWVRCTQCGRMLRIRPVLRDDKNWQAVLPRHKAETSGYHSLADAANATHDLRYGHGAASVWYARNPTFFDADTHLSELSTSHVRLGSYASGSLDDVWHAMQGECWSPDGQARNLITRLGLRHTSMSVGDVVEIHGEFHVCANVGWRKLEV